MALGNSIGSQGLFGSQVRPGMRTLPTRLGSLSGSSLGDDTPATADPAKPGTAAPVATGVTAKIAALPTPVKVGAVAAAAWFFFFRKGR